jgi:long-subunit acyl-CoA synthetase (AMP-forming)
MTGILVPNLEARILREDGSDANYDEIGELVVRGPTNALGYWNDESATKEAFKDGWLYTGDRFYVDRQDRFLYAHFQVVFLSGYWNEVFSVAMWTGPR